VKDAITKPRGKYPEALGNVVVIEFELWNSLIRERLASVLGNLEDGVLGRLRDIPGLSAVLPGLGIPENFTEVVSDTIKNIKMEVRTIFRRRREGMIRQEGVGSGRE
jgi:hypothetical protein